MSATRIRAAIFRRISPLIKRGPHHPAGARSCTAKTTRACRSGKRTSSSNRLRSRGGTVWYLKAADEGQSIRRPAQPRGVLPRVRAVPLSQSAASSAQAPGRSGYLLSVVAVSSGEGWLAKYSATISMSSSLVSSCAMLFITTFLRRPL